jgi:molecular chaperone DnaJ
MSKNDYYTLLGVDKNASTDEIKKAYRKQALRYHPDRNAGDKEAEENFKKVTEAYKVLSNAEKKIQYDKYGHDFFTQQENGGYYNNDTFSSEDPFEVFKEVFSGSNVFENFFSNNTHSSHKANINIKYTLDISLEDVASGIEKEIEYKRNLECSNCSGNGYLSYDNSNTRCNYCSGNGYVNVNRGFFNIKQDCSNCAGRGFIVKEYCKNCSGRGSISKKVYLKVYIPKGIETGSKLRLKGKGDFGKNKA